MDTPSETANVTTKSLPVVETSLATNDNPKSVVVTDRNHPWVDKVFSAIAEDEEYFVVEIKVVGESIKHLFHKSQVQVVPTK